jgi:hypothetical protein
MSNISTTIHWVDSISIENACPLDDGRAAFRLKFATDFHREFSKPETFEFSLSVNAASVAKFERIAAAIAEIMNENAAPVTVAQAAE